MVNLLNPKTPSKYRMKLLKQKAVFMIYLIISLTFFISLSSAAYIEEETLDTNACCEQTISKDTCQYTSEENCVSEGYEVGTFQKCEDTTFCQIGCCISEEGSCSKQTSRATCESEGFDWIASPNCETEKCQKGCCVLSGASCAYVTEGKCDDILFDYPELTKDYRTASSEFECSAICMEEDRGCCVNGDSCAWTTRGNCGLGDGNGGEGFYKDVYCSNDNLECDCEEKEYKGCLEGFEEVYWYDSCNNPEYIAEDCDYTTKASLCSEADEDNTEAYCKSVNCVDTWDDPTSTDPKNGGLRLNGESWCSYDAKVGPTFDVVGSRHYKHMCINGVEIVEPCKDYREEICISATIEDSPVGELGFAQCKENRWQTCTTKCNTAKEATDSEESKILMLTDKKCCEDSDLRDCYWIGEDENGICMPLIAPGLKFWSDNENQQTPDSNAVTECEKGTIETTAKWGRMQLQSKENSPWECKGNCEVYNDEYLGTRNQFCRSLGDCGAHYNYLGEFSETGFFRSWEGTPLGDPLIWVTEDIAGDFKEKWLQAGNALDFGKFNIGTKWGKFGGAEGFGGVIGGGSILIAGAVMITTIAILSAVWVAGTKLTIAAAMAATLGPVGWVISAAILLAAALTIMFTWPKTEDRPVTMTCTPWQAPFGGDECSKCDEYPLKPCSEYRCRSLGATCRFIEENEGTGRETCYEAAPNDVKNPKIMPSSDALKIVSKRQDVTQQFTISNTGTGYKISPAVPSFSNIRFGILTDELSQCFMTTEYKDQMLFSDLSTPFPDTYFSLEHNISYNNLLPNKEYRFYVSCRDNNGNPDQEGYIAPYTIELVTDNSPDLESPFITSIELPHNGKIAADGNETIIKVFVDEVSEFDCKIAKEDRDFDLMEQDMSCAQTPPESLQSSYSYCAAKANVTEGLNTFYIRCKDSEENSNTNSYIINFEKTQPLLITASGPSGDIYDRNITMFVELTQGADSGKAVCLFDSEQVSGTFGINNVSKNEMVFSDLSADTFTFDIRCKDYVNNIALTEISFTSKRDYDAPEITSLRKAGTAIIVELNEPATCEYSNSTFEKGYGQVSAVNSYIHPLSGKESYYLICEDIFSNILSGITIYPNIPKIEKFKSITQTTITETPSNIKTIGS